MKIKNWLFAGMIPAIFSYGLETARAQEIGPFAFHAGMQITRAYTSDYGADAEEFNKIKSVSSEGLEIEYNDTRGISASRLVRDVDRQSAQLYMLGFDPELPHVLPGSTTLGISRRTLEELRSEGKAGIALLYDMSLKGMNGVLTVVERNITTPVLVENELVQAPVMRVTGEFRREKRSAIGHFLFLDNQQHPVVISYSIKFDFEKHPRTVRMTRVSAGRSQREAMELTLKTLRKLDLYGIHFAFNKATIKRQAASLIADIGAMLQANPTWTLSIEGHTDAIGKPGYNLSLSEKRAAAVVSALVKRHGIDRQRLQSVGRGESNPKTTNDTLQGRAINRRVELIRTDR